jgi:energy-coupling factor transporter ATP-binding protein EcfA2
VTDSGQGLTLGRHYDDAAQQVGKKVVYAGERHVLLFGPNGTGKGTRFLIPNLLSIKDRSIIVVDPKGELASVTSAYRRTVGDVVMLNPFDVLGLGSTGRSIRSRRISMTTRRRSAKPSSRWKAKTRIGRNPRKASSSRLSCGRS